MTRTCCRSACASASVRWAARCPGRRRSRSPNSRPAARLPTSRPPSEVTVTRQVLAEPTSDIVERTWASLADGTPLVTGARREKGTLVLFHVTPEATWSNLPISGSFVEMLRRIVQLSRNQGAVAANAEGQVGSLAPYRMISADGTLVPPTPDARPLAAGSGEPTGHHREPARPLRHRGRRPRPQSSASRRGLRAARAACRLGAGDRIALCSRRIA